MGRTTDDCDQRLTGFSGAAWARGGLSFSYVFPAQPLEVRCALRRICQFLKRNELSRDLINRTELVLGEILNNVVEHAYEGIETGAILVYLESAHPRLKVCVEDLGAPMPPNTLAAQAPGLGGGAVTEIPEGGFGWHLIRDLTRELRYSRSSGHNRLSFSLFENPPI